VGHKSWGGGWASSDASCEKFEELKKRKENPGKGSRQSPRRLADNELKREVPPQGEKGAREESTKGASRAVTKTHFRVLKGQDLGSGDPPSKGGERGQGD